MSAEAPRIIADKFRLIDKLGQGGMGSVWRAEHLTLGSFVAVKLIDQNHHEGFDVRARFLREAKAAATLRSPHVVQILDYGVDADTPFIVMELLDGQSLARRLSERTKLDPQQTAQIIVEVARALTKAHEHGIIHRDLKPDNIFIVQNGDVEMAKVLDFGVAKSDRYNTNVSDATATGALLGTPYYMSPEQAEGARDVDQRSDVWALGVIAYECLVGKRPFDGITLGSLFLSICSKPLPVPSEVGDVPVGFDAWFERCAHRERAERFQSAREAARALTVVCSAALSWEENHPIKTVVSRTPQAAGESHIIETSPTLKASSFNVLHPDTQRSGRLLLALALLGLTLLGAWRLRELGEPEAHEVGAVLVQPSSSEASMSSLAPPPAPRAIVEHTKPAASAASASPVPASPVPASSSASVPKRTPARPAALARPRASSPTQRGSSPSPATTSPASPAQTPHDEYGLGL